MNAYFKKSGIKWLHFADNEGIMSEEIGSDESYDRKAVSESRWQV